MTVLDPQTPILVTITLTGEVMAGTPREIVTLLRQTAFINFVDNDRFMRGWSLRSELFTKYPIEWTSEESFIASNIEAGIIKLEGIE